MYGFFSNSLTSLLIYSKVDIVNHDGETPLNWATNANNEASISVLLKAHSTNFRHKKSIVEKPSLISTPYTKFEPHIRVCL